MKKLILYSKTNIDYKKRKRAKTYREDQTKENANKINFDHPSTNNIKLNTTRTKPSSLHITAKNLLKIELTQRMDHKTKHKSFMNINSLKNSNTESKHNCKQPIIDLKKTLKHSQSIYLQKLLKTKTSIKKIDIEKLESKKRIKISKRSLTASSSIFNKDLLKRIIGKKHSQEINNQFPMTSAKALKCFGEILSDAEKEEILYYGTIYFMGNRISREKFEFTRNYDDENDDYKCYVGDQVGYQYEIIDILGKGSFGQAIKCYDHKNKIPICLKIIRSSKKLYKQAMIEVKILKFLKNKKFDQMANMVSILNYFFFREHIVIHI